MEDKKDISSHLSGNSTQKLPIYIDNIKDDNRALYIHKKTEKIVAALYLITSLMDNSEPVKWNLRTSAVSLMSFTIAFVFESKEGDISVRQKIYALAAEINSVCEISVHAGLLSSMNSGILKNELNSLMEVVEMRYKQGTGSYKMLSREFYRTSFDKDLEGPRAIEPFHNEEGGVPGRSYIGHNNVLYKGVSNKQSFSSNTNKHQHNIKDSSQRKGTRREVILSLLGKKTDLTIRDFSDVIKDCSEKTIQRELIALVGQGVLKKEGERRWSRYSLKMA